MGTGMEKRCSQEDDWMLCYQGNPDWDKLDGWMVTTKRAWLTTRKSSLVNNRTPGARELVEVQANSKLIPRIGLEVRHLQTLIGAA